MSSVNTSFSATAIFAAAYPTDQQFIYIPPKTTINQTLKFVFMLTMPIKRHYRSWFFLISPESGVNIEFITVNHKKHDVSGFHQALCSFYLGKDSHVTVTNVSNHTKQCVTEIYSTVFTDENAVYSSTDLHFNSETHKVGFRGYLNGVAFTDINKMCILIT